MTHEEAWAREQRKIDAETGGPYVVPPWLKKEEETDEDNTQGNDTITTDQAQVWLTRHGIETQLIHGKVQAKDIWTKDGIVYDEWTGITCELRWLRDWMNY